MAGGKGPRQKGDRFEREVVAFMQERGIAAERIPLSGSSPFGSFSGYDLNVPLMGQDLQAECKHSGGGFKTLYRWLSHGSNDFLIIRADRSAPLAVLPLELLANLSTGYAVPKRPPVAAAKKKAAKKTSPKKTSPKKASAKK